MDSEFEHPGRRSRFIVVVGVVLAVIAAGAAFMAIDQAQKKVAQADPQKVAVVVAVQTIPARKIIEESDVAVREVPIDPTNANAIVSTPDKVVGRMPAVTILSGQLVTTNLLASSNEGGVFSILRPEETVAPDSPTWRAVSITVPDDRAVGGMVVANETVDVFVTASINVLGTDATTVSKGYYSDKSTKISYQDMTVLAKTGTYYILRAPIDVAEEILHLQASGGAEFSLALRPDIDTRQVDTAELGTTTNDVIIRYGLPIPVLFPPANGPIPTPAPTPTPTATPDSAGASPDASPGASQAASSTPAP
ncbi:MAG TPA: SAF domain-containing protein [Candidatus Limnocylindrales bacterium]|nr:SAF domain-containing protein [Candidatus Limnocylindrales bacterium]